jgi:hypothetical protein
MGKFLSTSENASRPPADAPMLTTEIFFSSVGCGCAPPFPEPIFSLFFFTSSATLFLLEIRFRGELQNYTSADCLIFRVRITRIDGRVSSDADALFGVALRFQRSIPGIPRFSVPCRSTKTEQEHHRFDDLLERASAKYRPRV